MMSGRCRRRALASSLLRPSFMALRRRRCRCFALGRSVCVRAVGERSASGITGSTRSRSASGCGRRSKSASPHSGRSLRRSRMSFATTLTGRNSDFRRRGIRADFSCGLRRCTITPAGRPPSGLCGGRSVAGGGGSIGRGRIVEGDEGGMPHPTRSLRIGRTTPLAFPLTRAVLAVPFSDFLESVYFKCLNTPV